MNFGIPILEILCFGIDLIFKWLANWRLAKKKINVKKIRRIIHGHLNKVRVERYLNIKEILKKIRDLHAHLAKYPCRKVFKY